MGRKKLIPTNEPFIDHNYKTLTDEEIGFALGVSSITILNYRKERGLKKNPGTTRYNTIKSSQSLYDFIKEKGYKNVSEAIDGFGSRQEMMQAYKVFNPIRN